MGVEQFPLVGGQSSTDSRPSVGALLLDTEAHPVACTGTLIAPDVVLTAAHCIALHQRSKLTFTVSADPRDANSAELTYGIATVHTHPEFSLRGDRVDSPLHDIALIILSRPVASVTPDTVGENANPVAVGDTTLLFGYGPTTATGEAGVRNQGTSTVLAVTASELTVGGPPPAAQACFGDSGGPAFAKSDGEGWQLVGVASRAAQEDDTMCELGSIYTRVDAHLGWINSVLAAKAGGCASGPIDFFGSTLLAALALLCLCARRRDASQPPPRGPVY
jgi:secreted trypsin-like serine protease